jgi:hypothetical protein
VTPPVQLALFGPQPVHIATVSPVTREQVCAMCRVALALAGAWDRMEGCHQCAGLVLPAPVWTLGGAEDMAGPLPSLAASLEAA